MVSAFKFPPATVGSARALEDATVLSLCGRGLLVRERSDSDEGIYDGAPYATVIVREDCGCGLSDNHHEFILSIHVRGFECKLREVRRLIDDAERAALMVGTHLREWQIHHITVERSRILRHNSGGWIGCLSIRALLTKED